MAKSDTQNIRWKTESSKKKKKRADWPKLMKPPLETIDLRDFFRKSKIADPGFLSIFRVV